MKVYIVTLNNSIMSVCADKQTALREKQMIDYCNDQNAEIKICGVVSYDEEYHNREMEIAREDKLREISEMSDICRETFGLPEDF